ncbi:hypothetical protein HPB47_027741, partial [Ixodes persulcatus]
MAAKVTESPVGPTKSTSTLRPCTTVKPSMTTTTAPEVQTTRLAGGGILKMEDVTYKSMTVMRPQRIKQNNVQKCQQEAAEKREIHMCYYHCSQYGVTYEMQPGTNCGINQDFGACFMDKCVARPMNAEALTCEFRAQLGTKGRGFAL